jgi:hypothetical protein
MRTLIIVDTEKGFVEQMQAALEIEQLEHEYSVEMVTPRVSVDVAAMTLDVVQHVKGLNSDIAAIFVDIVLREGRRSGELDSSGLGVADALRAEFPTIPVYLVTEKLDGDREVDVFSLATTRDVDGVFHKSVVTERLTRSRLVKVVNPTRRAATGRHRTSLVIDSTTEDNASISEAAETVKKRFGNAAMEPALQREVAKFGASRFWELVEDLLPGATGTIAVMRPGRSGAAVFKVTASTRHGASQRHMKSWVVKVDSDRDRLARELAAYKDVAFTPLRREAYPRPLHESIRDRRGLGGFVIELELQAVRADVFLTTSRSKHAGGQLAKRLLASLEQMYGKAEERQVKFWSDIAAPPDKHEVLASIDAISEVASHFIEKPQIASLRNFVLSDAASKPSIREYESAVDMRMIHGDLNTGNFLISKSGVVFIDPAMRHLDYVGRDIAKVERDILLRVCDMGTPSFWDWARLQDWTRFNQMYESNLLFDLSLFAAADETIGHLAYCVRAFRLRLSSISEIVPSEYYLSVLGYALTGLTIPDLSMQKRVFALDLAITLMNQVERLIDAN